MADRYIDDGKKLKIIVAFLRDGQAHAKRNIEHCAWWNFYNINHFDEPLKSFYYNSFCFFNALYWRNGR